MVINTNGFILITKVSKRYHKSKMESTNQCQEPPGSRIGEKVEVVLAQVEETYDHGQ